MGYGVGLHLGDEIEREQAEKQANHDAPAKMCARRSVAHGVGGWGMRKISGSAPT